MSKTSPAYASIFGDERMESSMVMVYLLRAYRYFIFDKPSLGAPSEFSLESFMEVPAEVISTRIVEEELFYISLAFRSTPAEELWSVLRGRSRSFENSWAPEALKLTHDLSRDRLYLNLCNLLNMLPWYKFDPHMITSSLISPASTSHVEDIKWRLLTQVCNLFSQALAATFSKFTKRCMMVWDRRDGVFQCDNVLNIWPEIQKSKSNSKNENYGNIEGPKHVGEIIKKGLAELNSDMIEGEPCVYGFGFVTIKLSSDWMAENIHNMLRDGIETWAPRERLGMKKTIVYSPSWDETNLMPMDVLRRQLIIMSRMHMLEYVKSAATTCSGNGMSMSSRKLDEHFRVVERGEEMLIYYKDERATKPLIIGKSRTGVIGERSGCFGYPLEDLAALRHGLVNEKADWMVCVTPSQQQDYIEQCFKAAKIAGWTTNSFYPLASCVGFKTCTTSLEDLLTFLYKTQYPSEAGEAAKVLGYTDQAVLDCALTYTFLKNHRLSDCKFNYSEMFDIKGDTFVYLLTTQAKISKMTNRYHKGIDELKKASKLVLEKAKVVWSEGVERELGFHLLMFTEFINESYLSFLPHLLCRYLYDLSKKFSHFYETYMSAGFEEKTRLLLCEATGVVMEKGFQLLGITENPSLQAVSAALALNYTSPMEVLHPVEKINIRTRFEMFTVYAHITRDEFKDGELFGSIQIEDHYGLRPEGWGMLMNPGHGQVVLMEHDWSHAAKILNNGRLKIGDPISRHSVPFSSLMRMAILFYASTKEKDDFFQVCNVDTFMNFSSFFKEKLESRCDFLVAEGDDGHIRMHYILLKDAVDATIKVKLGSVSGTKVCGRILAYYDEFNYGGDKLTRSFYKATLFASSDGSEVLKDGGYVPLTRSTLAVPNTGGLVIEAHLRDFSSGDDIVKGSQVFRAHEGGSFYQDIDGKYFPLKVEVAWSYD